MPVNTFRRARDLRRRKRPNERGSKSRSRSTRGEPVRGYDQFTAREIQSRVGDLGRAKLQEIRDYELEHKHRKTVLDQVSYYLKIRGTPAR